MADEAQNQDKPRIITDEDWKAEAQREKEELAHETEKQPEGGEAAAEQGDRHIPPASFITLVNTLATQAMMALGGFEDPQTGKRYVDLELAKFHIDSLAILQEKTEGNLDDDEAKLLEKAIYELRMGFVRMQQVASQQVQQQAQAQANQKPQE